jgi:hypothetical protein
LQALAVLVLLSSCGLVRAAEEQLVQYRLHAEGPLESDFEGNYLEAREGASFAYRDLLLSADSLTADRPSGEIKASGNVHFSRGDQHATADSLTYNLNRDEGALRNVRLDYQGIILRGATIDLSRDHFLAREASFTTCDRDPPHYRIQARSLDLALTKSGAGYQPDRLKVKGASIWFGRRRLVGLPNQSLSLREQERPGLLGLPTGGLSSQDGPFLTYRGGFDGPFGASSSLEYRYTTRRGVRARWLMRRPLSWGQLSFTYSRRQDLTDRGIAPGDIDTGIANVLVNQEPELALQLHPRSLGSWLQLQGELSLGRYQERPTGVQADRASVTLRLLARPQKIGRISLQQELAFRSSRYHPGDKFDIALARVSVEAPLGPKLKLGLSYIRRWPSGASPFLFDRVEIRRELLPDVSYEFARDWRLQVRTRQDLRAGTRRDAEVQLIRTRHCLEYGLVWREARGLFGFSLGLSRAFTPAPEAGPPPRP